MIRDLNITATITRAITIVGDVVTVIEDPEPTVRFLAQLDLPRTPRLDLDGAPRNTRPHRLRWRLPPLGPNYLGMIPGGRVTLSRVAGGRSYENAVYEIIESPRVLRRGAQDVGVEANLYNVENLYPYEASVTDQGGNVLGTAGISLTTDGQYHDDRGTYENFTGYASVALFPFFKQNNVLIVNGKRYRLTSAVIDYVALRVRFTARLANAFS